MGRRDQVGAAAAHGKPPSEEEPVHVLVPPFVFRPIPALRAKFDSRKQSLSRKPGNQEMLGLIEKPKVTRRTLSPRLMISNWALSPDGPALAFAFGHLT